MEDEDMNYIDECLEAANECGLLYEVARTALQQIKDNKEINITQAMDNALLEWDVA
jgi:hypothetical protein